MGKLQELLADRKQQQEKANGQIPSQQVVQSKAIETKASAPQAPEGKKPSVLDRFKRPVENNGTTGVSEPVRTSVAGTANITRQTVDQGRTEENIPSVVEQSRPLTMAEKLKARAGNAKVQNVNSITSSVDKKDIMGETKAVSQIERPEVSEPVRELSASQSADAFKQNDGSVNVLELKNNLKYLAENIENKDIVKDIVRTIAAQVAHHPEIGKHMTRGEVNLMVRGLRQAYQVAAMNKQSKAEGKKKQDKGVDEIAKAFKDAGMNFKFN